ncbi:MULTISPECIES: hypothetical protein [Streptomyces]|uniref:hypothetical protein n=1 Tax=Streptomyces TaxID=1883 RepID=UPI0033312D3B
MDSPYTVEIEPEVRLWLMNLRDDDYLAVEHIADLLRDRPTTLGEPYCEQKRSARLRTKPRSTCTPAPETKEW